MLPFNFCFYSHEAVGGTEPKTGIAFPLLVDGLTYVGSGVRVK